MGPSGKTTARADLTEWLDARGSALTPVQWDRLEAFLRDVEEYNARVNITADSGDALLLRHVADGLAALPVLRKMSPSDGSAMNILDLGAGAGFVGMGIKIAWPESCVTLLESSQRKFRFLNWSASRMDVKNLRIVLSRAERADEAGFKNFDAVLARAVAPLPQLIPLAMPLAHGAGACIAYQTDPPRPDDRALRKALDAASAEIFETVDYRLPGESENRRLVVIKHRRHP